MSDYSEYPYENENLTHSGIHIVLPSYYAPEGIGLVDMSTSDGRFLFLLPWQGHVVVGTTDSPCSNIDMRPEPEEKQILWLLNECSKYLNPELKVYFLIFSLSFPIDNNFLNFYRFVVKMC